MGGGVIDFPPGKLMIFCKKETENIELVARPMVHHHGRRVVVPYQIPKVRVSLFQDMPE